MRNGTQDFVPGAESHHCIAFQANFTNVRSTHEGGPVVDVHSNRSNLSLVDLLGLTRGRETCKPLRQRPACLDIEGAEGAQSLLQCAGVLQVPDEQLAHVKADGLLRFAVANVCTLCPAETKRAIGGPGHVDAARILTIERSFDKAGYDIVGILESRLQGDVSADGEVYDMYSAGADAHGCCGSQLWVRRSLRARVTAVTPHSPRLLTGVISVGTAVLGTIVAHSPHEFAPEASKNEFYKDLEIASRRLLHDKRHDCCILLADMNAKLGSITSQSVGACGSEEENDNGSRTRLFLQCQGLCAVNTMCVSGCGPTWTGSRGHKARLDYIGLSMSMLPNVRACYVDKSIDLATAMREDHSAVALDLVLPMQADSDKTGQPHDVNEKQRNKLRPPRIDADALADPWRRESFERQLAYVSDAVESNAQSLEVKISPAGIDERLRHWSHLVLALARKVFGAKTTVPKKRWVSAASWDIVQWIAPTRRKIHSCQAAARDFMLRTLWRVWKAACGSTGAVLTDQAARLASWTTFRYLLEAAWWRRRLELLQQASRSSLDADRTQHLEELAAEADHAASMGNWTTSYKIVRQLAGLPMRALDMVLGENGEKS